MTDTPEAGTESAAGRSTSAVEEDSEQYRGCWSDENVPTSAKNVPELLVGNAREQCVAHRASTADSIAMLMSLVLAFTTSALLGLEIDHFHNHALKDIHIVFLSLSIGTGLFSVLCFVYLSAKIHRMLARSEAVFGAFIAAAKTHELDASAKNQSNFDLLGEKFVFQDLEKSLERTRPRRKEGKESKLCQKKGTVIPDMYAFHWYHELGIHLFKKAMWTSGVAMVSLLVALCVKVVDASSCITATVISSICIVLPVLAARCVVRQSSGKRGAFALGLR
jgi:hypothetical protein